MFRAVVAVLALVIVALAGCTSDEELSLLVRASGARPFDSATIRLLSPDDLSIVAEREARLAAADDDELRVAVTFERPGAIMLVVAAESTDGEHLSAVRCYDVAGVVEDAILLVPSEPASDPDGDGFPADPAASCLDLGARDGAEGVPCRYACPAAIAADCEPDDANAYPGGPVFGEGNPEPCEDGVDQNCDGDDACDDVDGDGYPACRDGRPDCDCDDANAAIHPRAAEICDDGVDQDCVAENDTMCDRDGDGVPADRPRGGQPDCDDTDAGVKPGADERCTPDGSVPLDENCNGLFDELAECVRDQDRDGFVDCSVARTGERCDCNDCHPGIHPGVAERCGNTYRDDCATEPPLECVSADMDGDGYPAASAGGSDCDDSDAAMYPGAPDRCGDGVPQSCRATDASCGADTDGDGYVEPAPCEGNAAIHPDVAETCNGTDDDCDGAVDENVTPGGDLACFYGGTCGDAFCTASFASDFLNCGGCRNACTSSTANACVGGVCDCTAQDGVAPCGTDEADPERRTMSCCDTGCENLAIDLENCGGCARACNAPEPVANACVDGTCMCGDTAACRGRVDGPSRAFELCCGASCVDVLTSVEHCGACDASCAPANSVPICRDGICGYERCNPGFADCDGSPRNGCETPLNTVSNCGTCGTRCSLANASVSCETGSCALVSCNAGFGNCDGDAANGCETPLNTLSNCGACGATCARSNGSASCATGRCRVDDCNTGFDDCDSMDGNGCETPLDTLTNCGSCGSRCDLSNASESCSSRNCRVMTCDRGFDDCDDRDINGCETALNTTTNCGSCGAACSRSNATATCSTGSCRVDRCSSGFADCDRADGNGCETPLDTTANCGACGSTCTRSNATATCSTGTCRIGSCNPGFGNCDGVDSNGCETPLNTTTHCGACGSTCSRGNATTSCSTGSCRIERCASGFADCDGRDNNGCEAPLNTTSNCGGCGMTCARANATASCSTGSCRIGSCASGFGNCDRNDGNGCEARLDTTSDCGGCGTTCARNNAVATCTTGSCRIAMCGSGFGDCDRNDGNGCEAATDTQTNCGGCGITCSRANASASCDSGTCRLGACNAGFGNCDRDDDNGCEAPLDTASNCGGCGMSCSLPHATATCNGAGRCRIGSCDPGFDNCDGDDSNGCETSTTSDAAHCGRCGNACLGECCDSDCVDTLLDPDNCGRCGNSCSSGVCAAGLCV